MQSSKLRLEGAIMLHFQMRIFLVLGVFFGQVKKGKEMRCEGLFHSILASPQAAAARRATALSRRTRPAKMTGERELRSNFTVTHRAIQQARLSTYLATMRARHIYTRLLVSSQQQLGPQVAVEGRMRSP